MPRIRATRYIVWATLAIGVTPALVAAPSPGATLSATSAFDIEAQPLPRAILEYSHQSGVQVTSPAQLLDGRESSRVVGELAASEALNRLLEGTNLRYDVVDEATVAIRPMEAAAAKEEPSAAHTELEEVLITGSNIRQSGSEIDRKAIPVETFSAEQFQSSAGETLGDYLRSKPAFTGRNGTPTNDYYGGGESTLNLRGLGEQYTLVLINGRRAAGEDGIADIGAVPEEAIESVEVLKSGSSAIYGANAVGGVVNVKLRQHFSGVEAVASYGNTTRNDAAYKRTALLFGAGFDKLSIVGSFGWQDRNGIFKRDRKLTRSSDWRYLGGTDERPTWAYYPQWIEGVDDDGNIYTLDGSRFGPGQGSLDPADFIVGVPEQSFDNFEPGVSPPYSRLGGHWSAQYELMDGRAVLFADGYYDERRQTFQPIGRPIIGGGNFTPLAVPASNPYNPFGREVSVTYVVGPNEYPYEVQNKFKTDSLLATAGVQGEIGALNYEVSLSRFEQKKHITWQNDVDAALAQEAVERTDDSALNVFGYWENSPDLIASLIAPPRSSTQRDTSDVITGKLSGKLFALPAGDVGFAVGAEHRKVGYQVGQDELKKIIGTYWDGADDFEDTFHRKVDAYFGELSVPLYRGRDTSAWLSAIELTGAVRHERYNDFGTTTVPQGALRFAFLEDSLILRASYAEGFRAPSLDELTPFPGLNTLIGIYDPYFDDYVQVFTRVGGNPDLKSEVGATRNLGLVFSPRSNQNLTLRLDYWQVRQSDTIQQPDAQAVLRGEQPGTIERDPVTGIATVDTRLSNTGDRTIEGLDFGAFYRTGMHDLGRLIFDFSTTYLTSVEHVFGVVTVKGVGRYTDIFGGMPRYRSLLTTSWEKGAWTLTTSLHYEPGVSESIPLVRKTKDYSTGDIQLAYTFDDQSVALGGALRNTEIYGGLENFWDEPLPYFASTYIGWENSLHDLRGRYYYMGVRKRF